MSHHTSVRELKGLVLSFHSLIAIETVEEERVRALLSDVAAELNLPLYEWSVTAGLRRRYGATIEGTRDALAALQKIDELAASDAAVYLLKDLAPHLTTPAIARTLRELSQKLMSTSAAIVITGDPIDLPKDLEGIAVHFLLPFPDEEELRTVIRSVLDTIGARKRVRVDLSRDDAQRLVRALSGLTAQQARQVIAQAIVADDALTSDDIQRVIRAKAEILQRGGLLELLPYESNAYELGGFPRLKAWLDHARVGFTREARELNLEPPKGLLLVGVQGCGKSLAAKFIAREWQLPLLKLDAGRLYEKYVGESEKNFRRTAALAEAMAPVVLWIDEIEKAFAQGNGDADGGLSQRLFGAFLTWLQEKKQEVFVVGAANDLQHLPPELLRKGRFDEIFFVDLPDLEERATIFAIHLRLRRQQPEAFDLGALAEAAHGYSGAEIAQAIVTALYRTLQSRTALTTEAILDAIRATVPLSVSRREDVDRLRATAAGRFTPVR
jgi:SpoVK/Ycf46/Vps4 family AAA+-type ATPase